MPSFEGAGSAIPVLLLAAASLIRRWVPPIWLAYPVQVLAIRIFCIDSKTQNVVPIVLAFIGEMRLTIIVSLVELGLEASNPFLAQVKIKRQKQNSKSNF